MDLTAFEKMDKEEILQYLKFLLWHYRVVDSFWFIKVGERCGEETAEGINEAIWGEISAMAARDLMKRFHIPEGGLDNFVRALRLFPWISILGLRIDRNRDDVTIVGESCPTQKARLRQGLGEFPCKGIRKTEFQGFASPIDPRIKVECVFAPPDPHPAEAFCTWRFTIEQPE